MPFDFKGDLLLVSSAFCVEVMLEFEFEFQTLTPLDLSLGVAFDAIVVFLQDKIKILLELNEYAI